jgi:hypothetical protein
VIDYSLSFLPILLPSRHKISTSIASFKEMAHPASQGEEAGQIVAKYDELHANLAM